MDDVDADVKKIGDYLYDRLQEDKAKLVACPIDVMEPVDIEQHKADHEFIQILRKFFNKFTDKLSNIGITIAIVIMFVIIYIAMMLFTEIDLNPLKKLIGQ